MQGGSKLVCEMQETAGVEFSAERGVTYLLMHKFMRRVLRKIYAEQALETFTCLHTSSAEGAASWSSVSNTDTRV